MTHRTITPLAVGAVALVTAGPALASQAGAQRVVAKTGQAAPVTIPGTGVKQGSRLRGHASIVARTVTVQGTQRAVVRLSCAKGDAIRGLASSEDALGFRADPHYVGTRSVKVTAFADARTSKPATGSIDALCV